MSEVKLHETLNAAVWAKEFCKRWPSALCAIPGKEGVQDGEEFEETMIGWFANAIMAGVDSVTAERDALKAARVKVKPLVWDTFSRESFTARSPFGDYVVELHAGDGWGMWTPDEGDMAPDAHCWHQTEGAALAEAQAYYEARVLAALDLTPDTSQIDAIRAALEAAHDAIADYPRIAPDEAEWTRYDEQIEYSQGIIRSIDPAAIAVKLKGDGDERA